MKRTVITIAISVLVGSASFANGNGQGAQAQRKAGKKQYEIVGRVKYELLDTTLFNVYRAQRPMASAKGIPPYTTAYFFKTINGVIRPLTIQYLKKNWSSVPAFHYALDAQFRSDSELSAWDPYQKMYKVKYLLRQALLN